MNIEKKGDLFSSTIATRLENEIEKLKLSWLATSRNNIATKYFYIDNLLPDSSVLDIYKAFDFKADYWNSVSNFRERKSSFQKIDSLDPIFSRITDAFHESSVIEGVSKITGIDKLESDPSLYAGGISMRGKGDFLNPHLDNSHDGGRSRYRRLNLLFYITPNWSSNNGGNLELWDTFVENSIKIPAISNRLVVMETDDLAWHSVDQINVDSFRICVSNYYFTNESPLNYDYYHVTSFLGRPNQKVRRLYGIVDNFLRQKFVLWTGLGRGSSRGRF